MKSQKIDHVKKIEYTLLEESGFSNWKNKQDEAPFVLKACLIEHYESEFLGEIFAKFIINKIFRFIQNTKTPFQQPHTPSDSIFSPPSCS
jgi:hypothetical protein